ncbi:MAG TPA: FGGY family carbohydrate kinase [Actinomycetota bacterium]
MSDVVVGLDLGTSGLKAVAVDAREGLIAVAAHTYPTLREAAGQAEQDPADWTAAVATAVRELAAAAPPDRWRAIGLSAMIPTLVTLDREGHANGPAVTWEDARAEQDGVRLRDALGPTRAYEATGQWIDGRYLLPMFARLCRDEPGRASPTARLAGAKDHLFAWLTGDLVTDPSTAAGFGCLDLAAGRWWEPAVAMAGVALPGRSAPGRPELPRIEPSSFVAPLSSQRAGELDLPEGLPVCLGAADSVAGAVGLGCERPGSVAYVAGTSTVILGLAARPVADPQRRYLVTPMHHDGAWGLEMDLLATGASARWLAELMGLPDEAALHELAAKSVPGADGLTFLPYLGVGEQGALWDPDLRGAIAGMTLAHRRQDVARALLDGIALETRRCLAVLDDAGAATGEIHAGGPAAASAAFRQVLADATGRAVLWTSPAADSPSAIGAARLAADAIGLQLSGPPGDGAERTEPAPNSDRLWLDLWERHERTRSALGARREPGEAGRQAT